ncbi:50S ribosomal protein L11 methyltransferase [Piscinibacter koreensis]|uniref:Ribosomal protein L11 methyltransferase n=1 Tax=Piscinibacter koreensis TaxID=2742824 RepID=A0A7Y6TW62_9BURK|nr:50S ribosomal protein L11 methyltransferase [Schlegelella koreensis]NUZ05703.1 50S ribosomal protein L11 methyltransferase [Schlegelella koreensis]
MVELTFSAPASIVEAASDLLLDVHDALSVSVEDADAGTDHERPLFGEPGSTADDTSWEHAVVKVLFASDDHATAAAAAVMAAFAEDGAAVQSIRDVDEVDWVRRTQSQFAPVHVAENFWIVPSWHEPPAGATRVIRLDPGLAFGTGTHPTTRMCLRWIAERAGPGDAPGARWQRVIDYGCGSGILAIGAMLCGAGAVDAVDIDPPALEATRANAEANGVRVHVGAPEIANGPYDLVIANILATPLTLLAPLLSDLAAPGGDLILAGILERQTDALKAAYAPWLDIDVADREDGWVLLTGRRAGPPGRA